MENYYFWTASVHISESKLGQPLNQTLLVIDDKHPKHSQLETNRDLISAGSFLKEIRRFIPSRLGARWLHRHRTGTNPQPSDLWSDVSPTGHDGWRQIIIVSAVRLYLGDTTF